MNGNCYSLAKLNTKMGVDIQIVSIVIPSCIHSRLPVNQTHPKSNAYIGNTQYIVILYLYRLPQFD